MAKAVKRKAPSRVRYEQANPTVSCRVPREIYDRLRGAKQAQDMSFADILKVGLGLVEPKVKKGAEVRRQGYNEGYSKGYAEAERLYRVTYPCSVCRKVIAITSENAKKAVMQYMREHGWGHAACHERRG